MVRGSWTFQRRSYGRSARERSESDRSVQWRPLGEVYRSLRLTRRREFLRAAAALGLATSLAGPASVEAQAGWPWACRQSLCQTASTCVAGPGTNQPVVGSLSSGTMVDLLAPSAT